MTSLTDTPDIVTITGTVFTFLDPKPKLIKIEDIAHALAHTCRFSGHTKKFYSVADHSLRVSKLCYQLGGRQLAYVGLLHDATEAYLTDMPSPIKRYLPDYQKLEANLWRAIATRFGLPETLPDEVHYADKVLLVTEGRDLCAGNWYRDWSVLPLDDVIRPLSPHEARLEFLNTFDLYKQ